ncbi:hypothetical protein B7494_g4266 [Chlorociboria aeruginascens]|nr:hypothetical protein B7494_g4266 [Chlorociboria aeruginascens]
MASAAPSKDQLDILREYTACDISDALLKLNVPGAGFLPDLKLIAKPKEPDEITIAPASTVLFIPKTDADISKYPASNIPAGKHWADLGKPNTIVFISQPRGQKNACVGGIMALRLQVLGLKGVLVDGRVRDVVELESTGLPIWALATSTVGAGASSKPHAVEIPLEFEDTTINPGDLVFSDPSNGVVIIPQAKTSDVIALLPELAEADDRVREDVLRGMTVQEAFKRHRG